jgi:hypothetical protein
MRFPIQLAQFLGDKTAEYRWFAIAYMILMFGVLPVVVIGLSLAGPPYVIAFLILLAIPILIVLTVNFIRAKWPGILPPFLKSWKWLPRPFRSLEPYDLICTKIACCASIRRRRKSSVEIQILKKTRDKKVETNPTLLLKSNQSEEDKGISNAGELGSRDSVNDTNRRLHTLV